MGRLYKVKGWSLPLAHRLPRSTRAAPISGPIQGSCKTPKQSINTPQLQLSITTVLPGWRPRKGPGSGLEGRSLIRSRRQHDIKGEGPFRTATVRQPSADIGIHCSSRPVPQPAFPLSSGICHRFSRRSQDRVHCIGGPMRKLYSNLCLQLKRRSPLSHLQPLIPPRLTNAGVLQLP